MWVGGACGMAAAEAFRMLFVGGEGGGWVGGQTQTQTQTHKHTALTALPSLLTHIHVGGM